MKNKTLQGVVFTGALTIAVVGSLQASDSGHGIPGFKSKQTSAPFFGKPEGKDQCDDNGKKPNHANTCGMVVSAEKDCGTFVLRGEHGNGH